MKNPEVSSPDREQNLSLVILTLMKGVAYAESDAPLWQILVNLQSRVRDYVSVLGLEMILDESEGYAYLRQKVAKEGEMDLPRLVQRRKLSYPVSLLLALIRKKMLEFDSTSGEARLILSRDEMVEMVRSFFSDGSNSARLVDRITSNINKVVELGFLRRLRGSESEFEVCRILKAFVDAQWLLEFEMRLAAYRSQGEIEIANEEEINS